MRVENPVRPSVVHRSGTFSTETRRILRTGEKNVLGLTSLAPLSASHTAFLHCVAPASRLLLASLCIQYHHHDDSYYHTCRPQDY